MNETNNVRKAREQDLPGTPVDEPLQGDVPPWEAVDN